MKQTGWKQALLGMIGAMMCRVTVGGCYPLIPGYFAVVYLEEKARWLISVGMLIGMAAFLPLSLFAKYGMSILIIGVAIRLCEWIEKKSYTIVAAAVASVATFILSIFGGILDFQNQISVMLAIAEAVFIFGFVIFAGRGVHWFMEESMDTVETKDSKDVYKEQRLLSYAQSFEGLSKTFLSMGRQGVEQTEELGRMQQSITGRICASCDACAICWEPANTTMYEVFSKMLLGVCKDGNPKEEDCKALETYCQYPNHIIKAAIEIFEQTRTNRAWYNRLLENREVIAQQLDAMAYIMQDCINEAKKIDVEEKKRISEIRYRAKECGIVVRNIHIYKKTDGHKQIYLQVYSKWGNCISVKLLTKVVIGAMELRMRPHKDVRTFIGKDTMEIVYEEEPVYHAVHGVAKLIKDGAAVSGDNFSYMEKTDGELVLCLSDGMGFGMRACRESEAVVDLMERFIEAGFHKETAIKMLNSAMVIRGEDEQYSTVDVVSVNLFDGKAEFYKIGAAATFIKHKNGSVECLVSTSLPVGVSVDVDIERASKKLTDGDFLVMVTDGVLEYLQTDRPEETMEEMIAEIKTNHPGLLAKKILERVMQHTGGAVRDDMTILAAALWEN